MEEVVGGIVVLGIYMKALDGLIVFGKFSPGLAVLIFETQAKVIQILSFLIIRNFLRGRKGRTSRTYSEAQPLNGQ